MGSRHLRSVPPVISPPVSLFERARRLREKMIATALVGLEDWSPLRPVEDAAPHEDEAPPATVTRFEPPPIRWKSSLRPPTIEPRLRGATGPLEKRSNRSATIKPSRK